MPKKKKLLRVEFLSELYYDEILKVNGRFISDVLNKIYVRDELLIYQKKRNEVKKFYQTTKQEDGEGYSDYLIDVKQLRNNSIFVEETEVLPFESYVPGNPYKDPKTNLLNKREIILTSVEDNEEKKWFAYDFGASHCQYKHLLKNTIKSLKNKCKKEYKKHNNKGILILTERMYLEMYVQIGASKEASLLTKKEENYSAIDTSIQIFVCKFLKDINKEFSIKDFKNSQFSHIYIVLNMYGKPLIIPLLYSLLGYWPIDEEILSIERMTRIDIKGKNDPIYNAKKV